MPLSCSLLLILVSPLLQHTGLLFRYAYNRENLPLFSCFRTLSCISRPGRTRFNCTIPGGKLCKVHTTLNLIIIFLICRDSCNSTLCALALGFHQSELARSDTLQLLNFHFSRSYITWPYKSIRRRAFQGVVLRSLACCDCGSESRRGMDILSLVSTVCC